MPRGDPKGVALTREGFERVSRVVRTVEDGGLGKIRTGPSRVQPALAKLAYPTTDLQPAGAFPETTITVQAATAAGSTPTQWRGGASSASSLTIRDWFQWGLNKRAKMLAFRPVPSKHWYGFQPPAAQWGVVSAVSSASCQVNPTTSPAGSGDTATTFTVQLPARSGIGSQLSTGDVIAYMPTHWGQLVCVSDYSSGGGGAGGGGTISKAGHYRMYDGQVLCTSVSTRVEFDLGTWTGSTNQSGMGLVTTGTYTIECTTPGDYLIDWSAAFVNHNSTMTALSTARFQVQTFLNKNSTIVQDSVRFAIDCKQTDNVAVGSCAYSLFLSLTSGDKLYMEGNITNQPAGSTTVLTKGTWTFARVEEPDPVVLWGKVSASVTTGAASTDPDTVAINPTTNAVGDGTDTATTYTVILPRRDGVEPKLSTDDVVSYLVTDEGDRVISSDYSLGTVPRYGKVTSGGVTTGAASTDPDTVDINPTTNAAGDGTDTDTTYTIVLPRRDSVEPKLTGSDVIAWCEDINGDRVIVSDYSATGSTAAAGRVHAVSYEVDIYPGGTGNTTTRYAAFTLDGLTSGSSDAIGILTTGTTVLECTTSAEYRIGYTLTPRANFTSTNATSATLAWDIRAQWRKNSDIAGTRRRYSYTIPSTHTGYDLYGSLAQSHVIALTSGDQLELELEIYPGAPHGTTWTITEGQVTIERLDTLQ